MVTDQGNNRVPISPLPARRDNRADGTVAIRLRAWIRANRTIGVTCAGVPSLRVISWIRSQSGDRATLQLVTRDATAAQDAVVSVHADDVDAAYAQAQALGYEIVLPLTTESWGVRRFFVRAPDGNIINVVQHRD